METPTGALSESGVCAVTVTEGQKKRWAEQGKLVKDVFCDAYRHYQKYHGRILTDEEWIQSQEEFAAMMKRFQGAPVCRRIMLAVIAELEAENA